MIAMFKCKRGLRNQRHAADIENALMLNTDAFL